MYRVVIVDDEPFMLEGMRLMIDWAAYGFELCGEASSAQAALHMVDTLRPHLLITDVRMPGMQGTDLAVIVSHYHPEVMLLFFSGFKDFAFAQSAIRSHAFGYLVKPIDPDEVHDTLRRVRAELDARLAHAKNSRARAIMLRDQVLRRIALGDDTPESLMRAAVLMGLKQGDPCYCAVLARERGMIPESVTLLLGNCGATLFQLSPQQCGLGFQQIERDLPMLERLLATLSATPALQLSVGNVHKGAEGFAKSLREALDAQGVLYTGEGALRLYRAFDAETAAWLARMNPNLLYDALTDERPEALGEALHALARAAAAVRPSLFSLRYMAASLDTLLTSAATAPEGSAIRSLWQQEALPRDAWLAAFSARLREIRDDRQQPANSAWPPAVQAAIAMIDTRYAQALTMGKVAADLHLNPAYLGQLVRRYTGATFHQRLLNTRIEHACVLLRQTARPVMEVAMEVGFRDVDYFSQQFRGRMGMSPVTYRSANVGRDA